MKGGPPRPLERKFTVEIMIGSKNPAKPASLAPLFEGTGVALLAAPCSVPVEEAGRDPAENALLKAKGYAARFQKPVVANDSALYLLSLPWDDPRQPGVFVRRVGGRELTDAEMVRHYSALAQSLGGRVKAAWFNGYAIAFPGGESACFLMPERLARGWAFYLRGEALRPLHPGYPLDSISEMVEDAAGRPLREEGIAAVKAFFAGQIEAFQIQAACPL